MENSSLAGIAAIYTAIALFLAILLIVLARLAWFYLALILLAVSERWNRQGRERPR